MKKYVFLISLIGTILLLNACSPACVDMQPRYVKVLKPLQPSDAHIWVNDDWTWNGRTRTYVQGTGNWAMPRKNRTYSPGFWQISENGHYWVKGRWKS
jgi:hypothetical protein